MTDTMHRLVLPLVFDAGISPGESSDGNQLTVARDGAGRFVLRGSSLAGALRQAWRKRAGDLPGGEEAIFGDTSGGEKEKLLTPSRLEVADCLIQLPKGGNLDIRTHNHINRHTGVVLDQALFSIESLPPGCTTSVVLWLRAEKDAAVAAAWIADLGRSLDGGLLLGGRAARGIGLARLAGTATHRAYNLADVADCSAYLDDHRHWRCGNLSAMSVGQPLDTAGGRAESDALVVDFVLHIPRGQDFVIGSGTGRQSALEPQTVIGPEGKTFWRIPGSALRGLFRAWVSRLAAREGLPVSLSRERFLRLGQAGCTGEDIGWCFLEKPQRTAGGAAQTDCPVAALFGWLGGRGRIHITDGLAEVQLELVQKRAHVVVDNVTGGAVEGMLFQNNVVIGHADKPVRFAVRMRVDSPLEREAKWLAECLTALDRGLIRVGSSKAAGRLALAETPKARGPHAGRFTAIKTSTVKG